jgi:hypothetical protein
MFGKKKSPMAKDGYYGVDAHLTIDDKDAHTKQDAEKIIQKLDRKAKIGKVRITASSSQLKHYKGQ